MSATPPPPRRRKVTTEALRRMKAKGIKISALTAYDHQMAQVLDLAGIDVILVGDSVATVVQGRDSTVTVTMEHMLYHASIVSGAVARALVVGDLPFMSFQVNSDEALRNAGRMVQESGVEAVKVEGGEKVAPTVARIVDAGIPVMGHVGLTPQSIHKFGTYKVRATNPAEADEVLAGARALQDAGASAVVVEKVPAALGKRLADELEIPVIGIGAGPHCDGQILVSHDMLGLYSKFHPRFVRRYASLGDEMQRAFESYVADVKSGEFPTDDESY
ncbi:3-methyl-2-oxobutanoate hydroxymethyltransferase [Engelhardtia mirabilis]|uniref:3-methyl-2-oxobutanoate hydroxymethyltransferase n=1 Tax=Engelhardtia mirabilis TaxID=2528011 RepID=A0A518BJW6_9BACT|nr:3-methyl-2-oxobutanoate hydroxymethyltransferase [Planctomycetes bacterium Pla133]QDV01560.1 3-methyl-2-oxobutanoate hydroxymethyltransferase [Planctomycetes bacterium Pla86]